MPRPGPGHRAGPGGHRAHRRPRLRVRAGGAVRVHGATSVYPRRLPAGWPPWAGKVPPHSEFPFPGQGLPMSGGKQDGPQKGLSSLRKPNTKQKKHYGRQGAVALTWSLCKDSRVPSRQAGRQDSAQRLWGSGPATGRGVGQGLSPLGPRFPHRSSGNNTSTFLYRMKKGLGKGSDQMDKATDPRTWHRRSSLPVQVISTATLSASTANEKDVCCHV